MQNKLTISNILILLSILITFISFNYLNINEFGMSIYYINSGDYVHYILQYIMYNFIHGSYMHLLGNILFIYLFGNIVENIITKNRFIIFFIFITIFNGI
ncbi:MAG: rhomboid family intramembrane serine protease, partial [Candidatus Gracilibacteria bacterium]|nr:rhomboid family intramembrane serine protease [Candidatus Gracilibacteria bacterium]